MVGFYILQSCFLKTYSLKLLFSLSGHHTDTLWTGHPKMDVSKNNLVHFKIGLTIQMFLKPHGKWLITEFDFSESLYLTQTRKKYQNKTNNSLNSWNTIS